MSVGPWQIILVLVIILIVFGAGRLPAVMRDLARGIRHFREGLQGEKEGEETTAADAATPPARRRKTRSAKTKREGGASS